MLFEAFQTLHNVYHENSTCPVANELMELLGLIMTIIKSLSSPQPGSSNKEAWTNNKDARTVLLNCTDWVDVLRKLATLQNSYNPPEMRNLALGILIF